MKKEISLPKGVTAKMYQDGDKIVIEYEESPRFKRGDFIALHYSHKSTISLLCLDDMDKYGDYRSIFGISEIGYFSTTNTYFKDNVSSVRLMTESEKQEVIDRLREAGKDWDAEKMEIVDFIWRPKMGDAVYFASPIHEDGFFNDVYWDTVRDKRCLKNGTIRRTKEEAISCTNKMLAAIEPIINQ